MKIHYLKLFRNTRPALIIAFFFICLSANGQSRFGVKTSISNMFAKESSILHSADRITYTHQVDFLGQSGSKSIGLFYRRNFNFLFLEADAMFAQTESQYRILDIPNPVTGIIEPPSVGGPNPSEGITYTEKYSNLDLSLVAGYRYKCFDFGLGPIFHRTISLDSQLERLSNYESTRKFIDPGFQFKIGYNWGPLNVGVKYEDFFLNAGDHFRLDNDKLDFDSSLNSIKLEVGIGF